MVAPEHLLSSKSIPSAARGASPVALQEAGSPISPEEAFRHIGEEVTVCGKVFGGKYVEHTKRAPTFINIGAAYPHSPCTVAIFGADRGKFSYKPERYFDGKTICITGVMKDYKGKVEIVISKEEQIRIQ